MRKILLIVLSGWLMLMFSCKEDDFQHPEHEHKEIYKSSISFHKFLEKTKDNTEIRKIHRYFPGYNPTISMKGENEGWIIDTMQVNLIITPERTTYTFGVIELTDTIEGYRNVLVVEETGSTTPYLLHYPEGIDHEGHTSSNVFAQEIDPEIFGRSIPQTCYISVYSCQACGSETCNYAPGWELRQVPCPGGPGGGGWDPGDEPGGGGPGDGTGFDPVGGGGSGGGSNNPLTPCQLGKNLGNDLTFKSKMQELKTSADNDNFEKGFLISPMGQYTPLQGNANNPEIPIQSYLNSGQQYSGLTHSHYGDELSVFSPADLIALYQVWQNGNMSVPAQNFVMGMVSGKGTTYLIMIEDTNKFFNFFVNFMNEPDPLTILDNIFAGAPYNINQNANNSNNEQALARLLKQLNVGVKLMKGYPENFNHWRTVDVSINSTVTINPCP